MSRSFVSRETVLEAVGILAPERRANSARDTDPKLCTISKTLRWFTCLTSRGRPERKICAAAGLLSRSNFMLLSRVVVFAGFMRVINPIVFCRTCHDDSRVAMMTL